MSKTRSAWTIYIVLRLLFFAVPFGILFAIGLKPWVAAIFAALIGVALSILLLSKPRATASESIYDWRNRDRTHDDIVEDEAMDAVHGAAPALTEAAVHAAEVNEVAEAAEVTKATESAEAATVNEGSAHAEPAERA